MKFAIIVIGRNEGQRLKRCLQSLSEGALVVYVDSGSTDGSARWVRDQHIEVIELDMSLPFTAARARNAGFRHATRMVPDLTYVQFLDGDCELAPSWLESAVSFLQSNATVGALCGRLKEREPDRSIYNWLCDQEWNAPAGEVISTGGIVMIRVQAFNAVGGYREDVIAAEDDELCFRMRAAGWRIWRLEREMGIHDAAMTRFAQWWKRTIRAGYAFAQGAHLHGQSASRHFVWESLRAWLWGILLPVACVLIGLVCGSWGWAALLIFPLQFLRQTTRNRGQLGDRATLALFQVLARFPESWGQIKFQRDRMFGRQAPIIEYK